MTETGSGSTKTPPPESPAGWAEALGAHADNPERPRVVGDTLFLMRPCDLCEGRGARKDADAQKPEEDGRCPDCKGTGLSGEVEEEFTVSPFENRLKAQFESRVRSQAKRAIAEAMASEGQEEADALRSVYMADLGAGRYNWDGEHIRRAFNSNSGVLYAMFLAMKRCRPDITEAKVREIFRRQPADFFLALSQSLGNGRGAGG